MSKLAISAGVMLLIFAAILLRKIITNVIFFYLKKFAARTSTTLDDKLFPAVEGPAATLVMVGGIAAAITVLQLSPEVDRWLLGGAKIAALAVFFWGLIRAGGAVLLEHGLGHEVVLPAVHLAVPGRSRGVGDRETQSGRRTRPPPTCGCP